MNATQLGTAANAPATPAGNASLFNFLTTGSTNSAIPDFKTIAASFFSTPPTIKTAGPVETNSTTTSKPAGLFLSRDREDNKVKDDQAPELPSTFLPIIPFQSFPTLTPQAPKHVEPMASQPTETKGSSPTPICTLPVVNQPLESRPILSPQPTLQVPIQSATSVQQQPKTNDTESQIVPPFPAKRQIENADAAANETNQAVIAPPKATQPPLDSKTAGNAQLNGVAAETTEVAKSKISVQSPTFLKETVPADNKQPHAAISANSGNVVRDSEEKQNVPSVAANKIDTELNTAEINTPQTNANGSAQKFSSKIEKAAVSTETKKLSQTKQSPETENTNEAEPNQTIQATTDQASQQQLPQSIDDTLQVVAPQAVVLEHSVNNQVLSHSTNLQGPQSVQLTGKSGQTVPVSTVASNFAAPASAKTPEALNNVKTTPVNDTNAKGSSKSKTEAAVKKSQRTNVETQNDASTATNTSHSQEPHAINSSQNTANKNQDTLTPQANIGAHAKSVSAKSAVETSDSTSPNATQIPDADDITPPSHAGINTAKLVQSLTQSELRVGLQTRDFGNIDIRTSASRHEFTAQISVEHSEVAHTLASELPNLYARLNEQQVPVGNIHIHNQSLSTSSGLEQRSQQSSSQQQSGGLVKQQMESTLPAVHEVFNSADRLDIRV